MSYMLLDDISDDADMSYIRLDDISSLVIYHVYVISQFRFCLMPRTRRFRKREKSQGKPVSTMRRRRKQPWYLRKYNAFQLARKAYSGVNYIRGLVNSEMLHVTSTLNTTIDQNGNLTNITAIAQGDTDAGRTGNSIFVRSLLLRWTAIINSTGTPDTTVRAMVVIDTQQISDTAPTFADILQVTASVLAPITHLNDGNSGRFKVLYNKVININSGSNRNQTEEVYLDIKSHVRYNGTASTDIQKGGIYYGFISDQSTAGTVPTVNAVARLGYHDN